MNGDPRVIELLTDMLHEMRGVNVHLEKVDERLEKVDERLEKVDTRLERLEEQQAKTNLSLSELRYSFTRLADELVNVRDINERLIRVEAVVFKR